MLWLLKKFNPIINLHNLLTDNFYGFEKVSTGASNDIERATQLARKMVTQWGFSKKMGPMLFAEEEGEVFLGRSSSKSLNMSDETAQDIDSEITDFINRNYQRAEKVLQENRDVLETMKDALMKYETIDALQIDDLMARTTVRPPAGWDDKDGSSSNSDSSNGKAAGESAEKTKNTEQSSQVAPDTSKPNGDTPAS